MSSFYLFEIFSGLYLIGALSLSWFLIKKKSSSFLIRVFLPALFLFSLTILLTVQLNTYRLIIDKQIISSDKIQRPLKIILMGDVHLRPLKRSGYLQKVANRVKTIRPDLIIFTGDFLFYDQADNYEKDFALFKNFSQIAPTYAVLGNHDYGIATSSGHKAYSDQSEKIKQLLQQAGIKILIDTSETITLQDQEIQIIGFDEFWHQTKNPTQAVQNLKNSDLKIGLSHNPDAAYLPESQFIDIILTGHTHGGQLRLPLIGALATAETNFPRQNYGQTTENKQMKIFNTSGLGESFLPIRLFNPPEMILVEIQ